MWDVSSEKLHLRRSFMTSLRVSAAITLLSSLFLASMVSAQTAPGVRQAGSPAAAPTLNTTAQRVSPASSAPAAQAAMSNQPQTQDMTKVAPYSGLMFMGCRPGTPVGQPNPAGMPHLAWTCKTTAGLQACEKVKPASVQMCSLGEPKNYP
jgi:hypothetical protein